MSPIQLRIIYKSAFLNLNRVLKALSQEEKRDKQRKALEEPSFFIVHAGNEKVCINTSTAFRGNKAVKRRIICKIFITVSSRKAFISELFG